MFSAGLSWWLNGKESTYQCRRCGFNPWVGNSSLQEEMATHSSIHAAESHVKRSLVGYSLWGCKESDMNEVTACMHSELHTLHGEISWKFLKTYRILKTPVGC